MEWHGDLADAKLLGAAPRALRRAAEHLLEESNRTVPLLEGILMGSGEVSSDQSQANISYNTPYARRQHEALENRHPNGRRAKWLELTCQERAPAVEGWLGEELKGIF